MKNILLQDDQITLQGRIRMFEERTGCELLLVVARASDAYPGAMWRFGVLGAVVLSFLFSLFFEFHHPTFWPLLFLILTIALFYASRLDFLKRFALSDLEVERECREKAVECFHTLGTAKVRHKVTAMIMVSLLEKKVSVLVDEKLKSKITQNELDELVELMKPHFRRGNMASGFLESIQKLEDKILRDFEGKVSEVHASELKDEVIFI